MTKTDLEVEMSGDPKRVLRALDKSEKKVERLEKKLAQTGRTSKKTSREGSTGMQRFSANIGSTILQYASLGAAIATVTQALRAQAQAADEAAQANLAAEGGLSTLAQLAAGDPKKFKFLVGKARQAFRAGGAGSLDEAANLVFNLESAGQLKALDTFAQLFKIVPNIEEFASSIGKVKEAFELDISAKDLISKGFAGAQTTQANVGPLLQAVVASASSADLLGLSEEETIASINVLANKLKKPETAGERAKALFNKLALDEQFRGKSLTNIIDLVNQQAQTPTELKELFGSDEAVEAFSKLANATDDLTRNIELQKDFVKRNVTDQIITSIGDIPEISTAKQQRIAKARQQLSRTGEGSIANLRTALSTDIRTQKEQESFFPGWLFAAATATSRLIEGDEAQTRRLLDVAKGRPEITGIAARGGSPFLMRRPSGINRREPTLTEDEIESRRRQLESSVELDRRGGGTGDELVQALKENTEATKRNTDAESKQKLQDQILDTVTSASGEGNGDVE